MATSPSAEGRVDPLVEVQETKIEGVVGETAALFAMSVDIPLPPAPGISPVLMHGQHRKHVLGGFLRKRLPLTYQVGPLAWVRDEALHVKNRANAKAMLSRPRIAEFGPARATPQLWDQLRFLGGTGQAGPTTKLILQGGNLGAPLLSLVGDLNERTVKPEVIRGVISVLRNSRVCGPGGRAGLRATRLLGTFFCLLELRAATAPPHFDLVSSVLSSMRFATFSRAH